MSARAALGLAGICILAGAGCDGFVERSSTTHAKAGQLPVAMKIDSILPPEDALRRFQSGLPRVTALTTAASSRDDLVARFVTAVEQDDSPALERLVVSKAEYAFLYFPGSAYMRKPYELPPDIAWLLADQNSRKGFTRLRRRLGGKRLELRGYDCTAPVVESGSRFWRSCHLTYIEQNTQREVTRRLFGPIIERGGAYKFLTYANDF